MYKLIKNLVPLVLVVFFFSVVIGTSWGEKIKSEMYLFTYDEYAGPASESGISNPSVGDAFKMTIKIWYGDEQIKDLKVVQPGDFKVIKSYINYGVLPSIWQNVFCLETPEKPGNYVCKFEGVLKDGTKVAYEKEIKVVEKKSSFMGNVFSVLGAIISIGAIIVLVKWAVEAAQRGAL